MTAHRGAMQPLREEARWNSLEEMAPVARAAVRGSLREWLPAQFQQRRAADIQQQAAFNPAVRARMFEAIEKRAQEAEAEIQVIPLGPSRPASSFE